MKSSWKIYLFLHLLLFINSFGGVCSKLAGKQMFFSFRFFLFYGGLLLILAIYAIFWQQIIKWIPLSSAYLNKPVSIVWGILWGIIFFQEHLTIHMIIGSILVLSGLFIVVRADE